MLTLALAAVHLVSLALGVAVLMLRGRALASAERPEQLKPVFFWDNLAGIVAIVWVGSGLWRAFGGLEKGSDYYLSNHAFWGKMLLLAIALGIECVPMITFMRWRTRVARRQPIPFERKALLVRLHWIEFCFMLGIVVMATLMARGVGVVRAKPAAAAAVAPDQRQPDLAAGEALYRLHCLSCHQADGRGLGGKLAADFVGDASRLSKPDEALLNSIANGVPNTLMRGFNGMMTREQMANTLAYLRRRFGSRPAPR